MSLFRYFKCSTPEHKDLLPSSERKDFSCANEEVYIVTSASGGIKRKRGTYQNYSPEVRAKIARYAVENGIANAARKFSKDLGGSVNKSTVRSIKSSYLKARRKIDLGGGHIELEELKELPKQSRVRPLLLGKYDEILQDYLRNLRAEGGIITSQIVISAATGILKFHDKAFLSQIELTKTWAESLLNRMGFVRRKGTKTARSIPNDFERLKTDFHERIKSVIEEYEIPNELIINWDQTGVPIEPGGQWTMDSRGGQASKHSGTK